ncbi:hypothetical protein TNCV_2123691 [Trichonephila clavipes]|nr:hypothetical protein TNCV_2123691 [Trichonephila clavipes]
MFIFSVELLVINLFLWTRTQHVIEHSLFRLSRQRGYSTSRLNSAFSRSKQTPLKMCGMLWEESLVETILRQTSTTLIRALIEEWDKFASTAAG